MRDQVSIPSQLRVRKHLNADALFASLKRIFNKIPDHRTGDVKVSLSDALMSGFAMFSLKDPSLLAFDERRKKENDNLCSIYGVNEIPSDTRMREILDEVLSEHMFSAYKVIFRALQRGKALEPLVFMEGYYLVSVDGTGNYSSGKISSESCLEKKTKKTGKVTYYRQLLAGAIVHPDFKEVIPLAPEMIIKQDGQDKNDCERNAAKRFFKQLRKDHPHLPIIITEDALSSNAPHIRDLEKHNLRYILSVKPGDHAFLFDYVNKASQNREIMEYEYRDKSNPEITHRFRFLNKVPLNESNQDCLVNFLEYWEITEKETKHFSWVTDFIITEENVYKIMRGGRARWKIENETFNTLKNQGYNFEHNYGLGEKHLSTIFPMLMMLAFLVDQTQQLCCSLFRSVWKKCKSKRALWENMRSLFKNFKLDSMQMLYRALLYGHKQQHPIILNDTS